MTAMDEFSRKAGKLKASKTSLKKAILVFWDFIAIILKCERTLLALNIPENHVY